MTIYLFANNAQTTLAAPIPASGGGSTTAVVQTGDGVKFPNPGAGEAFVMTFVSASNPTINEIVLVTARSGDTMTIVRAQEGTTALAWSILDGANNFPTAGTMANFVQNENLQFVATVGGTVNAITGTLASPLTALFDGMAITLIAAGANTIAGVTFDLTIGTTNTGVINVVKHSNAPLLVGDIPSAGYPVLLNYSVAYGAWVMQNPASNAQQLWVSVQTMQSALGTLGVSGESVQQPSFLCNHGQVSHLYANAILPLYWDAGAITVDVMWAATSATVANVFFTVRSAADTVGSIQGASNSHTATVATSGTSALLQKTSFALTNPIAGSAAGSIICFEIQRTGTSGSDTYADPIQIFGININYSVH